MYRYFDVQAMRRSADDLEAAYRESSPFPHVFLDQFVIRQTIPEVVRIFPQDVTWKGWKNRLESEHVRYIYGCEDVVHIPGSIDKLINELNSGPFLQLLSRITGIENLLPDPYLTGGGMHMVTPGGYLSPHTDFHVKDTPPRYRQLNLILYLNEGWTEENGGSFEMWDKEAKTIQKTVLPTLGTCVLFRTNNDSLHGYSTPVTGRNRCSVALFYYTLDEVQQGFPGDVETYWRSDRLNAGTLSEWWRLRRQQFYFGLAEQFSKLAHRSRLKARHLIKFESEKFNQSFAEQLKNLKK